jgi:hypothetical protein
MVKIYNFEIDRNKDVNVRVNHRTLMIKLSSKKRAARKIT